MKRRNHRCVRVALAVLALGLGVLPRPGRAQPIVGGQGFKVSEYYDPPHETQMKSLLEGAQVQRQPDGRVLVTDAKWRTFRVTGEGELAAEAPQCLYDPNQRTVSSSGPLHVQTADGKFSIEGEGFLWHQTNSVLLVSNRVHTILHAELFGPPSAPPSANAPAEATPGIDIFSDRFDYTQQSGLGVYQGNVRVAGTNLSATASRLTLVLPVAEHRLETLTAEENVIVDYDKIHATGGRAFYAADTELIQMTGPPVPTWRIEEKDGSGDELVFDRTNRVFRASGHARLRMPARSMGASGLLSRPESASAASLPPTNQFVEIRCDDYELRTNVAVFHDQVRVSERLGDQLQGEMSCRLMTLTFSGTNELQKMVAERQVVIARADSQFTADRAEYTGTNGLLELTGNPAWRAGPREGKGDRVRANLAREEMLVRGNAYMRLPAAELGQSAVSASGRPKPGGLKGTTNEFAEIFSEEYLLTPAAALFRGRVRIVHPQIKETCEELTMLTPPELGKAGRLIIAEPAVVFDVVDDQGRNFHGTGEKAVYTHRLTATLTNDIMELTGNPAVLEATNLVGRNKVITLDLASHKLMAPGKYDLRGTLPAAATNLFQPPKKRTRKTT
jgi:lipopolysaccharide export system protein LptA